MVLVGPSFSMVLQSIFNPNLKSRVDAQWITAKKDWQDAKRRHKMQERYRESSVEPPVDPPVGLNDSGTYDKEMDAMRCILYSHGGWLYFIAY